MAAQPYRCAQKQPTLPVMLTHFQESTIGKIHPYQQLQDERSHVVFFVDKYTRSLLEHVLYFFNLQLALLNFLVNNNTTIPVSQVFYTYFRKTCCSTATATL